MCTLTFILSLLTIITVVFASFSTSKLAEYVRFQYLAYDKHIETSTYSTRLSYYDWYYVEGYKNILRLIGWEVVALVIPIINCVVLLWIISRYITVNLYNKSVWAKG